MWAAKPKPMRFPMKTTLLMCCAVFRIAGLAWGQDSMTLEKFNTLVTTPGDTNAMRPELAGFPLWKATRCHTVIKLPDGRVFTEESVGTAKTIGGKYVVCSMDSQFSKEPLRAVIGYDKRAPYTRWRMRSAGAPAAQVKEYGLAAGAGSLMFG
jgi:hypothetical protein